MSLLLGWPLIHDQAAKGDPTAFRHRKHSRDQSDLSHALTYEGDGHLITFAPTGAGKGVGVIIPNLLQYQGPVIVVDPKGENFGVTARFRKQQLGQKIIVLDPFHAVPDEELLRVGVQRAGLNPLDVTKDMRGALGNQALMLADLIAGELSAHETPFWDLEAKKLVAGLIDLLIGHGVRTGEAVGFKHLVDALFGAKSGDPIYDMSVLLDTLKPCARVLIFVAIVQVVLWIRSPMCCRF